MIDTPTLYPEIKQLLAELYSGARAVLGDIFTGMYLDGSLACGAFDFASNVKLLLEKEVWGVYNMVCGGITSRLEVAQEIVRLLGLEGEVLVTEVTSDYFSKEYFAPRPDSERLINRKLDLRGLTGATVLAISRAEGALSAPAAGDRLRAGDVLALAGSHDAIEHARRLLGGEAGS